MLCLTIYMYILYIIWRKIRRLAIENIIINESILDKIVADSKFDLFDCDIKLFVISNILNKLNIDIIVTTKKQGYIYKIAMLTVSESNKYFISSTNKLTNQLYIDSIPITKR